ncbi:MAG: hypothetical protein N2110_04185 [Flavobacteriales bacterium]|nr:hypothetical protein [Flavobacteriales bacterium]MCX7768208.1 hypothetical protein [Flavobacteriales bacterium]MDW8409159.1 hypothetical protein [Flavobacteriales bacterium]
MKNFYSEESWEKVLEAARKAYENNAFTEAIRLLQPYIRHGRPVPMELLKLAYETEKKLGRYRRAIRLLKLLFPYLAGKDDQWLESEWALCRRKVRHSNADTFLFFGVCFTAFYVTARVGLNHTQEEFLWAGVAAFFIGFSLRRFYIWDKY